MSPLESPRRSVLKLVGATTGAIVGGGALTVAADSHEEEEREEEEREENGEDGEEDEEERGEEAEVKFEDQTVESEGTPTVYVEEVKAPEGGWIVIHNWGTNGVDDGDNPAANFIGVSAYLEPGEYENLPVELGGDQAVADPPSDGSTYTVSAMAHRDDPANRTFDFPNSVDDGNSPDDPPYVDDDGNIVQTFADVTFEAE